METSANENQTDANELGALNVSQMSCEHYEDVTVIAEHGKALLCRLDDGHEQWIPKSVLCKCNELWKDGDSGTLCVFKWFAEKEIK